jgi:peptidoglycan/LPS O-acetylase OafA/YrhL
MQHASRARWNVPGLDGLRAVAVIMVIVWHVVLTTRFSTARFGAFEPFVRATWVGVDLFFALSGFLITSLLLREERRSADAGGPATFSLKNFYVRRTLRILPVFYVVFALVTLVFARIPTFRSVNVTELLERGSTYGLWPYALFLGNYFEAQVASIRGAVFPGNALLVFWSLCVEEHFYLLWPFTLTVVRSSTARAAVALAFCALLPALRFAEIAADPSMHYPAHIVSHLRIDSLLWGALAAIGLRSRWLADLPRRLLLAAAVATVVALLTTRQLSIQPHGTALGSALGLSALALAGALLTAEFALRPDSLVARGMDAPWLRFVGRLSFAMYLVHFPMIDLAKFALYRFSRAATLSNLALLVVLSTAFSIALAWLIHRLVERPFLALKERFN